MVAAGHVESVQDAFDSWIDRNGPAYVPRQGMQSRAAIDAILDAGGVPVLAHYPAAPEQPDLMKLLIGLGHRRPGGLLPTLQARDVTTMEAARGRAGHGRHGGQ